MKKVLKNIESAVLLGVLFVFLAGCEELTKGPQFNDQLAPKPVISPEIENVPGGAIVKYSLPDDTDLLYVVAEYTLSNGEKVESKSSIYLPYIEILGYGDTGQHEVSLFTVDRGENRSEPVVVTIQPLAPFVSSVKETISMTPDFGGVMFRWENPGNAPLAFIILAEDSTQNLSTVETVYSGVSNGQYTLRGFNPVEKTFAIVVRDQWKNYSDTLKDRLTPLFEQKLDPSKFSNYSLPGDAPMNSWEGKFENMYDGVLKTFGHSAAGTGWPQYFTMNLGVMAKISRVVVYQRDDGFYYGHGNPRLLEIWGCANEPVSDGSFEGWIKIKDCVAMQPSQQGGTADEDKQHALDGDEFSFTLDDPAVRYIRILVNETWGNTGFIHISEIAVYGQVMNP